MQGGFQRLADPLIYWAHRAPSRECLVVGSRRFTYGEIYRGSRALAASFLRLGLRSGDRIVIWLPNGPEWVFTFFAAALVGLTVVPANTRYRPAEITYLVHHSEAVCLVYTDQFLGIDFAGMVAAMDRGACLKHLVCVRTAASMPAGVLGMADLLEAAPLSEAVAERLRPAVGDPAVIQYTSGTTAAPKGAVLGGGAYVRTAQAVARVQEIEPGERFFSGSPFFHCSGSMHGITTVFAAGGTLVTMPRWDAEEGMHLILTEGCTVAHGARLPHHDLVAEDWQRYRGSLKRAVTTGSADLLLRLHDEAGITGVSNVYGMTETCGSVSLMGQHEPVEDRVRSNGRPHPGLEVAVRDPITVEARPTGTEGELWVRGWNLLIGYDKNPEATRAATDDDGWFRTGDLCRLTADGKIILIGRLKEMLRVGGENVAPAEVELLLEQHPAVQRAAVVPMPDHRLDEVPCAFVQLAPGRSADEAELIRFCRERIANFKAPRRVVFVDRFPETPTNRIQKHLLVEEARRLGSRWSAS